MIELFPLFTYMKIACESDTQMGNAYRGAILILRRRMIHHVMYFLQKMRKENDACEHAVFQNYRNPLLIFSMQKMCNMSM